VKKKRVSLSSVHYFFAFVQFFIVSLDGKMPVIIFKKGKQIESPQECMML